jgi:isoquinoline 1-oxidoreductase
MPENLLLEPERYELHAAPLYNFTTGRRDFFKILGGGFLVLTMVDSEASAQLPEAPKDLESWLHISESGEITAFTGKVEFGQNIRTSLTQAVAEELRTPPSRIKLVMADTALTPYDMGTFGSRTTPTMAPILHQAAAAAREMLLDEAAARWKAPRAQVEIADGVVRNNAGGEKLSFGEITRGRKLTRTISAAPVTPATQWKIAGHDLKKLNAGAIVTGREKFTSDMKLPGMMYGRVVRPAAFRATPASVDTAGASNMPGVVAVRDGDFLGVVCDESSKLDRAAAAIKADWKTTPQIGSAELYAQLKAQAVALKPLDGDLTGVRQLDATYNVAYIAHTPLEPRAAVAQWEGDRITVWTGTQVPFGVRSEIADAFGISEDKVRVIVPPTGSGYGGKHSGECAVEAARLARAAGKPVKLQWTREEEFTWAYFRPAGVIEVRSGARSDGTITHWQFHNYNSGNAAVRSPYEIPGQISEFHPADSPLRQGSYRGLAASANHFARESHMDEMAHALGMEPAAFRMKNASDQRLRAGQGFGMMAGFDKGGYVSACCEITVTNGVVKVDRIVQAFECGAIVNPDELKNQVAGGTMMGIGGALFERIDFANGRILNARLSKYRVPRFSDMPEIDVVLVDRKDLPSAGAGETPIVAVAPAVANAIFDATGKRLRSMPLKLV